MKNRPADAVLIHTDGVIDMIKVAGAFRNLCERA